MQAPTELVLIRHGQTDWNLQRRIQGSSDIALNALGLAQAQATRDALANETFDAVYSSQLDRARVTAATINEPHGAPHHLREGLMERKHGEAEGANVEQTHARWPDFVGIPGLESWLEVSTRMLLAFEEIVANHPGQRVLVVSHGSALRAAFGHIQRIEPRSVKSMWNCSISRLHHAPESQWDIVLLNSNEHLPEPLRT